LLTSFSIQFFNPDYLPTVGVSPKQDGEFFEQFFFYGLKKRLLSPKAWKRVVTQGVGGVPTPPTQGVGYGPIRVGQ
jgi:hypothetical protein